MGGIEYLKDGEARQAICEYGRRLYARGLVGGNEGNISCRVGKNAVWVTPTMESKGYLVPDMLIKVDLDGNVLEKATHKPSSETKLHLGVYKQDEAIQAVFHAHPIYATAYSIAHREISCMLMPESLLLFGDEIPVAEFGMPGTFEVPDSVIPFVKDNKCCLMSHHGAITWGKTMKDAYFLMEEVENYCHVHLTVTEIIKKVKDIPSEKHQALLDIHKTM